MALRDRALDAGATAGWSLATTRPSCVFFFPFRISDLRSSPSGGAASAGSGAGGGGVDGKDSSAAKRYGT